MISSMIVLPVPRARWRGRLLLETHNILCCARYAIVVREIAELFTVGLHVIMSISNVHPVDQHQVADKNIFLFSVDIYGYWHNVGLVPNKAALIVGCKFQKH